MKLSSSGQVDADTDTFFNAAIRNENDVLTPPYRNTQVCTVDAFQGAEKDIVIVASTRTERLGFIVRYDVLVCMHRAAPRMNADRGSRKLSLSTKTPEITTTLVPLLQNISSKNKLLQARIYVRAV